MTSRWRWGGFRSYLCYLLADIAWEIRNPAVTPGPVPRPREANAPAAKRSKVAPGDPTGDVRTPRAASDGGGGFVPAFGKSEHLCAP